MGVIFKEKDEWEISGKGMKMNKHEIEKQYVFRIDTSWNKAIN